MNVCICLCTNGAPNFSIYKSNSNMLGDSFTKPAGGNIPEKNALYVRKREADVKIFSGSAMLWTVVATESTCNNNME